MISSSVPIRPLLATPPRAAAAGTPAPATPAAPASPPKTARQERIGAFLHETERSALDQTKFLTATWMGELVGMAVGGAVMGPIGLAMGNLYFITGGTALLGGLGALAGYAAEKHHLGSKIANGVRKLFGREEQPPAATPTPGTSPSTPTTTPAPAPAAGPTAGGSVATPAPLTGPAAPVNPQPSSSLLSKIGAGAGFAAGIVRATPNIVYPTISAATAAEKAIIMNALESMPLRDVTSVSQISVVDGLENLGASGMAQPLYFRNQITLGRESLGYEGFGHDVTVHEVGHTLDFTRGFGPLGSLSMGGPFGKGPYFTDSFIDVPGEAPYAATNRIEDFAQTHMAYHTKPDLMRSVNPEKFEAMDALHHPGPLDRALDRPGVRNVGRSIGELYEQAPYLRMAVDLAGALIAPATLHNGAKHLDKAMNEGDDYARFQGKMRMATGFAYMFKAAAPLGLVTTVAQHVMSKSVQSGAMTVEEAHRKADKFLAVSMGPIGTTGMAAFETLEKEGITPHPPANALPSGKNVPGIVTTLAGTLVGSYLGQMGGALVGTALGGVGGAVSGAYWGKIGGAMLGLGAVAAYKSFKMRGTAAQGGMTGRDKLHLAGVLGGATVGGALGTAAGSMGGAFVGGALGGAVGGPVGAGVGSFIGRVVGVVGLSYAGARVGSSLGSKIAPDDGT